MLNKKYLPTSLMIILVSCLLPGILLAEEAFKDEVLSRIKAWESKGNVIQVSEQFIVGSTFIASLYQSNGYERVWNDDSITDLRLELKGLEKDGLNPEDYWFSSIDSLVNKGEKDGLVYRIQPHLDYSCRYFGQKHTTQFEEGPGLFD